MFHEFWRCILKVMNFQSGLLQQNSGTVFISKNYWVIKTFKIFNVMFGNLPQNFMNFGGVF